jgi:hypothetical protein
MAAKSLRTVDKLQANTLLLLLLLPCIQTFDASLSLAFFMKIEILGFVQNEVSHQKSNL